MNRFKVIEGHDRLMDVAERAVVALDAGGMGSWSWHLPSDLVHGDARMNELWGIEGDTYPVERVFALIHHEDEARVRAEVEACLAHGVDYATEFRVKQADGTLRWLGARGRVMERDESGAAVRMLGVNWDMTDAKLQEERLRMIAAEMNHRVENSFGVMAALIQIGARSSDDKASYATRLRGQVQALAESHRLSALAARGAPTSDLNAEAVPVSAILAKALAAWLPEDADGASSDQVTLAYRADPKLSPRQAAALAMLAYELTTNAVKYGALADEDGHLTITLDDVGDGDARLRWTERCAAPPAPTEPEGGTGFGTILVRHCASMLRGNVTTTMTPQGLRVEAVFPARNLASGLSGSPATIAPGALKTLLAG